MDWRARLRQAVDATGKEDKTIAMQAGIAAETLSRILNGEIQDPGINTMSRLAAATGVSIGWLLGEEPFSRADDPALVDIINYLNSKRSPAAPRTEPNAIPATDAIGPAYESDRRVAFPAQATPDAEQDPNAAPARRSKAPPR